MGFQTLGTKMAVKWDCYNKVSVRRETYKEEARGVRAGVAFEVSGLCKPVDERDGEDKP